jgi:TonB-dependent SusC/RagA subfamily outer membrane receptor
MKSTMVAIGLTLSVSSLGRTQEPICMIDGARRAASDCSGMIAASIERIEVVKGPNAASMYGPDAAGGAISITTKKGPGTPGQEDPFARYLFPPELVMANQQAINLTDRQRSAIQQAMKEAQGKFIDAQFKMSGEAETLQRLLQGTSVDESKVLDQVDRVLTIEREIKHVQLTLMMKIKNQLTAEQQTMLTVMRTLSGAQSKDRTKKPPEPGQ